VSPAVARRLCLALAASLLAAASCQGPDPYYRNRSDGGGLGIGAAGAVGSGFAGTYLAGTAGAADTAGSAGSAGAAATSGAAGAAGAAGGAGRYGAAGSAGAAGAAGAAGSSGAAGAGGAMGAAGQGVASGQAGASMPCTTCMVKLQYTCRSADSGQASFVLDVTNEAAVSFPLSSLTLRYWYTIDATKEQELDCDYAKLGCTNLVTSADTMPAPKFVSVMPPKMGASEYAEIAFKAGALALDPFLDTGEIQLRLHNKDYSPITQSDDYSFNADNCNAMSPTAVEWSHITAYLDGVLVWGTEPEPLP
jgi:hypothetical protein